MMDRPTRPIPRVEDDTQVIDGGRLSNLKVLMLPGMRKWWFTILIGVVLIVWSVFTLLTRDEPAGVPGTIGAPISAATRTPTPSPSPSVAMTPTPTPTVVTQTVHVAGPTVYVTETRTATVTATQTVTATVTETRTATVTATQTVTATPTPTPTASEEASNE